jgi:DNA-binding SARP family transcriptional activator/tetratricopeptide (TPR) repeat protein
VVSSPDKLSVSGVPRGARGDRCGDAGDRDTGLGFRGDCDADTPPQSARTELYLSAQKAQALLYYLAAQPGRAFPRAHLITLLWEESPEREGRNSLSTVLTRLRQALPVFPIATTGDTLMWQPTADMSVDLVTFQALTASPTGQPTIADLERAAALWRGGFLDGFGVRDSDGYEAWLRTEREQWQGRWLSVVGRLVDAHQQSGAWAQMLAHAQWALATDPLHERFHRAVMTAHALSGDRAAALAQYRTLSELLMEELGAEPDRETTALHESIVHGTLTRPAAAAVPVPRAAPPPQPIMSWRPPITLVGREAELATIERHLSGPHGFGRLILVQGEAGIGKTRLVEELFYRIEHGLTDPPLPRRPMIPAGHCYETERSLPYYPFVEAIRSVLPYLDLDTLGVPDVWLAEVNRLLPEIGDLRPDLPTPPRLDPQQEQRRLFEGLARFLGALPTPTLVVLADIHRADTGTLQLLAYFVRNELTRHVRFLATVRPEDTDEALASLLRDLDREGRLTTVRLARLSAQHTVQLLNDMVREGAESLAERLHAETEGNPLFVVEVVRSLMESGRLQMGATSAQEIRDLALPDTVQAVIRSRLDRLDAASRQFLTAAAIFDGGFDFDDALAVSGQPEEEALDALETLLHAQLLRETNYPGQSGAAGLLYVFSHDKIRQVVYEAASGARRRILHRRVLDVLAQRPRMEPERLAYHAFRGQIWDRALDLSEAAAAAATKVFAYAEAVRLYLQALECLQSLPPGEELQRRGIALRLRLAQVAFYAQPGRLLEWLAPAEEDAIALGDNALLAEVWFAQASAIYIQGQFTEALPRLERLLPLAEELGTPALLARTTNIMGRLLVLRGEYARGIALLERAIPLLAPTSEGDALVSTGLMAAGVAYMGDFARARRIMDETLARSVALHDPVVELASLVYCGANEHMQGNWEAAIRYGREGMEKARAIGNRIYEYNAHFILGLSLARTGQIEEAIAVQEQAIALGNAARIRIVMGRVYGWLGEILHMAGRLDDAREAAIRGREISLAHGYLAEAALCDRVQGEIEAAFGLYDRAAELLENARAQYAALGARPEIARVERALGQLARARGDSIGATSHLRAALDDFTALDMRWDADHTRALLAEQPVGSGS